MTAETKGWDLVTGITQTALNREIAIVYTRGYLPKHIHQSIDKGILSGSIDIDLGIPSVDLNGGAPDKAVLTLPITKGKLSVKGLSDFILDGAVITVNTRIAQMEVETKEKQKQVMIYLDLLSDQRIIKVTVKGPELRPDQEAVLNALLDLAFGLFTKGTYFMGTVSLSGIDVPPYLMPKTVAFSLFPDKKKADLSEFQVLVRTMGSGGPKPFGDTVVPDKSDAVLLMANERLLANVVGGALAEKMTGAQFVYTDNNYRLTNAVPFQGYTLTGAVVTVTGNAIHIRLDIAAMHQAGGGINIFVRSDTSITVSYDSGKHQFMPVSNTPNPATSWTLEWWVYLVVGLIAVLLGLVAGIVAIIVSVVVAAIAAAVASPQAGHAIDKAFKSALLPVKWPAGEFLVPASVDFPKSLQLPGNVPRS